MLKHAFDCFTQKTGVKVNVQWFGRKVLTQNVGPALNTDNVPDLIDQDISQLAAGVVAAGGAQSVEEVLDYKLGQGAFAVAAVPGHHLAVDVGCRWDRRCLVGDQRDQDLRVGVRARRAGCLQPAQAWTLGIFVFDRSFGRPGHARVRGGLRLREVFTKPFALPAQWSRPAGRSATSSTPGTTRASGTRSG